MYAPVVGRPYLRLLTQRSLCHNLRTACSMTRTKAQGRAAATAETEVTAAEPAAATVPKFSPALTAIDPTQYDAQLEAKVQRITSQFADFNPPALQAYRSRPEHYRMRCVARLDNSCQHGLMDCLLRLQASLVDGAALRGRHQPAPPLPSKAMHSYVCRAEFRVWHEGQDLFYIMFEKDEAGNNREVRVDTFPVASGAKKQKAVVWSVECARGCRAGSDVPLAARAAT